MMPFMRSDPIDDWSDGLDKANRRLSAQEASDPRSPAPGTGSGSTGLDHRALQTLRETRLQVCSGPRTRAQVLSVGEPLWSSSSDGVHPARDLRRCRAARGELSKYSSHPGRDLRDQPRAASSQRGAWITSHVEPDPHRHLVYRNAAGPHGSGICRRTTATLGWHDNRFPGKQRPQCSAPLCLRCERPLDRRCSQ